MSQPTFDLGGTTCEIMRVGGADYMLFHDLHIAIWLCQRVAGKHHIFTFWIN